MIVLKIIGIFLLFLLLLTFLSLGITVHYQQEELKVYVTYAFIKLQLFPEKKKKKKNRPKQKRKKTSKKATPSSSPSSQKTAAQKSHATTVSEAKPSTNHTVTKKATGPAKPIPTAPKAQKEIPNESEKKESLSERISTALDLLRSSKQALLTIKEHVIVDQLEAYLSIGGEDAHQTALNFSYHQIAIAEILALLGEFLDIRLKKIVLIPNFLSEESDYQADIRLRIRPFWVIKAGIHLLVAYVKLQQNNKGGKQHERKTTTSK